MYDASRDPAKYLAMYEAPWFSKTEIRYHQSTRSYGLSQDMIGNKELPLYAKALDIYVPSGSMCTISVVGIGNKDDEITVYTRPPGVYLLAKFIRRVVDVQGPGVVINVEHD